MTNQANSIEPHVTLWLIQLAGKGRASNTLDCYRRDIRDVCIAMTHVNRKVPILADLCVIGQPEVIQIANYWVSVSACDTTIVRRFSALKTFARYLSTEHKMNCTTILSAEYPTAIRKFRPPIEADASEALAMRNSEAGDWITLRSRAVVTLAAASGLTTAEIVGLNQQDFSTVARILSVTKSRLCARIVAISGDAAGAIQDYQAALPFPVAGTAPLFLTNWRTRLSARSLQLAFRKRRQQVGLAETAVPIALRHSLGYNLAWSGASPEIVARALGLSLTSVSRYFRPP
jgi:integrase/recombinase XerC